MDACRSRGSFTCGGRLEDFGRASVAAVFFRLRAACPARNRTGALAQGVPSVNPQIGIRIEKTAVGKMRSFQHKPHM
jgi:hypothetical protein